MTVGITVAGGRITDVIARELPGDEPRSVSISAKAGPVLRQRALAAQSAAFDSVSGATWTSDAFKVVAALGHDQGRPGWLSRCPLWSL